MASSSKQLAPDRRHRSLIHHVSDHPGHDRRYAIDPSHIEQALGWTPSITLEDGLAETVRWYAENEAWWTPMLSSGALDRRGVR